MKPMYPSLFQLNTKAFLSSLNHGSTLDDIPEDFLVKLSQQGFEWIWLLGVWAIGPSGQNISRSTSAWVEEYRRAVPDLQTDDICGSPFAITGYSVDPSLGGDKALERIRARIHQKGMRLMVDFIPNHIGFDHPWVSTHPDYLIPGKTAAPIEDPGTWIKLPSGNVFAFGRDPHFPGWPDTLQLNYFNPSLRQAMIEELQGIAKKADGIRCDMAMLIEPEIFLQTWGNQVDATDYPSFWRTAIPQIREVHPDFTFMAEVYWNYEWRLQQHGFNYTYDKTLYDRLLNANGDAVRLHLTAPLDFQSKLVRFLENHDEQRIAHALSLAKHKAAAVITYCSPGMRFFHHGQTLGMKVRIPVHLRRGPTEQHDPEIISFYEQLIPLVNSKVNKEGVWRLLNSRSVENATDNGSDALAFFIQHDDEQRLVTVNYSDSEKEFLITIPNSLLTAPSHTMKCLLSGRTLDLTSAPSHDAEFQIRLAPWEAHIFSNSCTHRRTS